MSEPTSEMIEAGSRTLCRAYQIDDGFSEEQADQAANGRMGLNFRREAKDCYLAMRAADPEMKALVDALDALQAIEASISNCGVCLQNKAIARIALRNISGGDDE